MNKPAIIEAILADAVRAGNRVMPKTTAATQSMLGSVQDKLTGGPKGLYDQFRTKVVDDANASANAIRDKQIGLGARDNYQNIKSKETDALASIAELIGSKPADILNRNAAGKSRAAIDAAIEGIADNSLRGVRRRGAEWVAANPDTAIPVGLSAAGAGGAALLTASGAALDALTKNMAQALKTEENRDNVLTS